MVEPTKLLEDLGVIWIVGHDPFIRQLGVYELPRRR